MVRLVIFAYRQSFGLIDAADSAHESTESDDEFQICDICYSEEVNSLNMTSVLVLAIFIHMLHHPLQERKKLLQCSCCGQLVHPECLVPPLEDLVSGDWSCHSCKEQTEEFLQKKQAYIAELLKRFVIQKLLCGVEVVVFLPNYELWNC